MNFQKVIERVVGFLEQRGSTFSLVGGLALQAHGVSRATFDLDLALVVDEQAEVVRFMESLGYETLHLSPSFSNHVHPDAEFGRVDFIYVDEGTAQKLRGPGATTLKLGEKMLPVPSAEHLVAMKVHAMKQDARRSLKERADIQALWRATPLNEAQVREYFVKAGMETAFDELKNTL